MRRCTKQHTVELDQEKEFWICIECESKMRVEDHHITYLPIQLFYIPTNTHWDNRLPTREVEIDEKLKTSFLIMLKRQTYRDTLCSTLREWGDKRCGLIADLIELTNVDEVRKLADAFYIDLYWYTFVVNDFVNKTIQK